MGRHQNTWYLYGVTSYGFECARVGVPAVYVRVSSFVAWILDNTQGQISAPYTSEGVDNDFSCVNLNEGVDSDEVVDEEDPLGVVEITTQSVFTAETTVRSRFWPGR